MNLSLNRPVRDCAYWDGGCFGTSVSANICMPHGVKRRVLILGKKPFVHLILDFGWTIGLSWDDGPRS
jgi:hypothetical protein